MRNLVFILYLFASASFTSAQNRFVNWYFGDGAGITFKSGNPVILSGGKTQNFRGNATMSDPCGNLLFYTDGVNIWNRKHTKMVNSTGLAGTLNGLEAVIVPMPLSDSLFYFFGFSDTNGFRALYCSIIDISKQGGDGEVIKRNILLTTSAFGKLTVVLHSNKKDYWIITRDWKNSEYKAFLLNETGLNLTPVISKVGTATTSESEGSGYLRPSPDGSMLASSFIAGKKNVELFNFNNSTGGLSFKTSITNFAHSTPWNLEFSPDGKILYVSENKPSVNVDLYQFDLTVSDIAASRYTIIATTDWMGNFAPGPDGKLYIARYGQNYLGVITNPNTFGSGVNYVQNGFNLGSQKSGLGLPNIIYPVDNQNPEYAMSVIPGCKLSDPVKFELLSNFCYDSLVWDLSDFSSSENISRKRKLSHVYPYRGNYDITLYVYYNGQVYTYNKNVKVPATPDVDLGKDKFFCDDFSYFLDAGNPGASYLWNDNYTGKTRNVTTPGKYYVTVTQGNCFSSDTVILEKETTVTLGNDTTDCVKSVLTYTNFKADSIIWANGMNGTSRIFIAPGGTYTAKVYKGRCVKQDTIMIFLPELYGSILPNDTTICEGETIVINAPKTSIKYLWNDGLTTGSRIISKEGTYELMQSGGNCVSKQNFRLKVLPKLKLNKIYDTSCCIGEKFYFTTNLKDAVLKINGVVENGDKHTIDLPGYYFIKGENECFKDSFSFNLTFDSCLAVDVVVPEVFTPNGDILNETFSPVIMGNPSKIQDYNFRIFTRWGENIYQSEKYGKGWDGSYLNKTCQSGYYIWTCQFKYLEFGEPKSFMIKGLILIVK